MSSTIKTYSGDTWDAIAWRIWGKGADQEHVTDLIEANQQYVNIAIFNGAVELTVPDIEESEPVVSIPPWRE